ncbi:response regulator [Candidatus Wolfebacteria bacterium]|nr:response regulator [Candidatus Wolfebacteria bacterium]
MEEKIKILVVDDQEAIRVLIEELFQLIFNNSAEIFIASSGNEALEKINSDFSLVLTDQEMPGMLGTELIARIKEIFPDMKVVLMSGNFSAEKAAAAGADGFLAKPFGIAKTKGILSFILPIMNILK